MKKIVSQLFISLLLTSTVSCSTFIDFLDYAMESEASCCAAFDSMGCQIGFANCYEDCQELLTDSSDYCQCNCPD